MNSLLLKRALLPLLVCALAACNQANVTGSARTYALTNLLPSDTAYSGAGGTATITPLSTGDTGTVLLASKLKPSTLYGVSYHASGTDVSGGVCTSNGQTLGSVLAATSDASGSLTFKALTTTLSGSTYLAVQEVVTNTDGTQTLGSLPLCADLTGTPIKK
ncbi:hypothetical protein [Deinococcus ruber]|nr:hypothetical protein [Deinococcus ruber]